MNKKWLIGLFAAAVILAGAYFGSPYYAVHSFKSAAQSGDADRLEAAIDFPVVRESLKSQLTSALMEKFQNDPEMANNPFSGFGMMMVPSMVSSMVDGFVTPEGMARLTKSGKMANEGASQEQATPPDADYEYVGLDRFRVRMKPAGSKDEPVGLLFERRGLFSWKMIRLEIPDAALNSPVAGQQQ